MNGYNFLKAERLNCLNRIEALEEQNAAANDLWVDSLKAHKPNTELLEKKRATYAANEHQIFYLNIKSRVLFDMMRERLAADVVPEILKAFADFNGKPYGPKTKDKIYNNIKAVANISIYIDSVYQSSNTWVLGIHTLNEDGYLGGDFYGEPLRVSLPALVNKNNIISANMGADWSLLGARGYIDPDKATEDIIKAHAAYNAALGLLSKAHDALNDIKPGHTNDLKYMADHYRLF